MARRRNKIYLVIFLMVFVSLFIIFRSCYNNYFGPADEPVYEEKKVEDKTQAPCEGDLAINAIHSRIAKEMAADTAENVPVSKPPESSYSAHAKLISSDITAGRMMKVMLKEEYKNDFTGLSLSEGSILYGQIKIVSDRVACNFIIAENESKKININLYICDNLGVPGINKQELLKNKELIVK